jgi:hypothetical protein
MNYLLEFQSDAYLLAMADYFSAKRRCGNVLRLS